MEMTITDYTVDGKCSKCGACCSNFLPMTEEEVRTIHKYLKSHPLKEQRHNVLNGIDATCPFRSDEQQKCLIYEQRPSICRAFMCNHTMQQIQNNKAIHYLACTRVVDMRLEYFNNTECQYVTKALQQAMNGLV